MRRKRSVSDISDAQEGWLSLTALPYLSKSERGLNYVEPPPVQVAHRPQLGQQIWTLKSPDSRNHGKHFMANSILNLANLRTLRLAGKIIDLVRIRIAKGNKTTRRLYFSHPDLADQKS